MSPPLPSARRAARLHRSSSWSGSCPTSDAAAPPKWGVSAIFSRAVRGAAVIAFDGKSYRLDADRPDTIDKIRGASIPWPANPHHRLEQVRYSWEQLAKDTGVTSGQILARMVDYGLQHYMTSRHPMLVPEPFSIEPGESYSLDELDECLETPRRIADEAYTQPALVKTAPQSRGRLPPRRSRRRRLRQMRLHLAPLGAQACCARGLKQDAGRSR